MNPENVKPPAREELEAQANNLAKEVEEHARRIKETLAEATELEKKLDSFEQSLGTLDAEVGKAVEEAVEELKGAHSSAEAELTALNNEAGTEK